MGCLPASTEAKSQGEPKRMGVLLILDNPIAVREWRLLLRRAWDWRIWVGLKWTLDPIVWGAPVILTYLIAPYGLWAMLACLRGLHLTGKERVPFDAFLLLVLVFWCYVAAISLVLGATAITHEREQKTWDHLRVTALSKGERAAGFLWGRLGPVWSSVLVTGALWWLLWPSYFPLLAAFENLQISRNAIGLGTLVTLGVSLLVGEIGLLASARFKSSAVAVALAVMMAAPLTLLGAITLFVDLNFVSGDRYMNVRADELHMQTAWLVIFNLLLIAICNTVWDSLKSRLDAS
jgi:hypothetical protein